MIQLTFQAAFDPFHAAFRLLRLRPLVYCQIPLHRDHVRIIDYYLLFPFRISSIRLSPQHRKFRRLAEKYSELKPYSDLPDDHIVFGRMEPIQEAALETLAKRNVIRPDRWALAEVQASDVSIDTDLQRRIEERNKEQSDLLEFLVLLGTEYRLLGPNGLKARSGLLEHRYDSL